MRCLNWMSSKKNLPDEVTSSTNAVNQFGYLHTQSEHFEYVVHLNPQVRRTVVHCKNSKQAHAQHLRFKKLYES